MIGGTIWTDLGLFAGEARAERIDDSQITIAADGHHGVSADEHGNDLRKTDNAAHDRTEGPIEQHKSRHEREGNAEKGDQYVADGHVDDEEVGHRPLANAADNDRANDSIANQSQEEYDRVHRVEHYLEQRRRQEGIEFMVYVAIVLVVVVIVNRVQNRRFFF